MDDKKIAWFISVLLQQGINIWAALETTGAVRIALWVLVGLSVVGILMKAAQSEKDEPKRVVQNISINHADLAQALKSAMKNDLRGGAR